jgi:3',5'-cyclic AMP phosphodiesterase CpdA
VFGPSHYAFEHRGVHFIALDNVSLGQPDVGPEQLAWLRRDLARFAPSTPIVVFTHRPLFDLKPEWEWYTGDGDQVMNLLAPYENVTVLYGHIHRNHVLEQGHARHFAARSLIFGFPDPATTGARKPLPFDPAAPFKDLGLRRVDLTRPGPEPVLDVTEVELRMAEFAGTVGSQQLLKGGDRP